MQNAIEVRSLAKRYSAFTLDGVSFTLPRGCIMGLIGENGAGKSTTIRLLLGLARRDGGDVSVLGEDPQGASRELRERIGVVFDDCPFPEAMTLRDVRRLLSAAYKRFNAAKFDSLGLRFALPERQKIKDYSRGMKMKLSIAAALSHGAELLILDEPTSGLDPETAGDVERAILSITGRTVVVITHNWDEAYLSSFDGVIDLGGER